VSKPQHELQAPECRTQQQPQLIFDVVAQKTSRLSAHFFSSIVHFAHQLLRDSNIIPF
jgi:hypothetical protein